MKKRVSNKALTNEKKLENLAEAVFSQIKDKVELIVASASDSIKTNTKELLSQFEEVIHDFTEQVPTTNKLVENSINTQFTSLIARIVQISELVKSQSKTNIEKYESGLDSLMQDSNKGLSEVKDKSNKEIETTLNEIPNVISETLDVSGKSIQLLSTITQGASIIEPSVIETTYLQYSKEQIVTSLNGLLKRTKSKIDIITPDISWIDPSQFEDFSRRTITIVTDTSKLTKDESLLLKKIDETGTPVKVKKFDPSRLGSRSELNVILVNRDGEEIMISKPPSNEEAYGIITQDEIFVSQLSQILSPFMAMPPYNL